MLLNLILLPSSLHQLPLLPTKVTLPLITSRWLVQFSLTLTTHNTSELPYQRPTSLRSFAHLSLPTTALLFRIYIFTLVQQTRVILTNIL